MHLTQESCFGRPSVPVGRTGLREVRRLAIVADGKCHLCGNTQLRWDHMKRASPIKISMMPFVTMVGLAYFVLKMKE